MLTVTPIPAFQDNYIWLIADDQDNCAVVDPGDAQPVLDYIAAKRLTLKAILITHHHPDHIGGVNTLLQHNSVPVYGPSTEAQQVVTHPLEENDELNLTQPAIGFKIIHTPGHTNGHIAYYGDGKLFCGDTLFSIGCGRLFEGTPSDMYHSLHKLQALPDETLVYCTHEYTQANLAFALSIEPQHEALLQRQATVNALRQQDSPSIPVSLSQEKLSNPFLRCDSNDLQTTLSQVTDNNDLIGDPIASFATLRQMKDNF